MDDVVVHRMPVCGHEMNRESLLGLALSTMNESTKLSIRCPHRCKDGLGWAANNKLCNAEWPYAAVLEILRTADDHCVLVPQKGAETKTKVTQPAPAPVIVDYTHCEDDITEDIDAVAVNAMFADSDADEESDEDSEVTMLHIDRALDECNEMEKINEDRVVFEELEKMNEDRVVFSDLFDSIDPNDHGDVDEKEWISGLQRLGVDMTEHDMKKLFSLMDGANAGYIDRQDWNCFCMSCFESKEMQRLQDTVLANLMHLKDDDSDDEAEALQAIDNMFSDDDSDDEDEEASGLRKTLNGLRSSCVAMFDALRKTTPKIADPSTITEETAKEPETPAEVYEPYVVDWKDLAKLELLAARNLIQQKCDVQKCPRCKSLHYRNADDSRMAFEDITTIEHVEKEFKFECCFCPAETTISTKTVRNEMYGKVEVEDEEEVKMGHREDDEEEDIDADALNAMFGAVDDDDSDEDNLWEELNTIAHMFDDDQHEFEEVTVTTSKNTLCWCCGAEWKDGHQCDEAFKRDLCEILKEAEKKKIGSVTGVPSIRCCPECCQLIFHTDACKHMRCRSCNCDFCFVCMGIRDKDNGWSCGGYSEPCPVKEAQTMETLPDTIVVTKRAFKLYE